MPYKAVLIIGPNWPITEEMRATYAQEGTMIIGDGLREVLYQEIKDTLSGNIDSNTRVDICAHGGIDKGAGKHIIEMSSRTSAEKTSDVLATVAECSNTPSQVHLWSCFGGAAAKDVQKLPKGSCLIAHAPEDSATLLAGNNKGMIEGVQQHMAFPVNPRKPVLNYQNILNGLSWGAGQKSFLAVNLDERQQPLIVKDRLPERKAQRIQRHGVATQPDIIRSTLLYHYSEAYNAIAPILERSEIKGVIPPFSPTRNIADFSEQEVQNFYTSNLSYQAEFNWEETYHLIASNDTAMQRKAVRDLSGLLILSAKPNQIHTLLQKGLDPNAKLDGIQPSGAMYNKSVTEYCATKGFEYLKPILEHNPKFNDIALLNRTGQMFEAYNWARTNNNEHLQTKIQQYIFENEVSISKETAKKLSPEASYSILKAGVKIGKSKELQELIPRVNVTKLNMLTEQAIQHGNDKFTKLALDQHSNKLSDSALEAIAIDAMSKGNAEQIKKVFNVAVKNNNTELIKTCLKSSAANFSIEDLNNALYKAAENKNLEATKLLLKHPFNNDPKVMTVALKKGSPELYDTIAKASLNVPQPKKESLLTRFIQTILKPFRKKDVQPLASRASSADFSQGRPKPNIGKKKVTRQGKTFADGRPRPNIKPLRNKKNHAATKMRKNLTRSKPHHSPAAAAGRNRSHGQTVGGRS